MQKGFEKYFFYFYFFPSTQQQLKEGVLGEHKSKLVMIILQNILLPASHCGFETSEAEFAFYSFNGTSYQKRVCRWSTVIVTSPDAVQSESSSFSSASNHLCC